MLWLIHLSLLDGYNWFSILLIISAWIKFTAHSSINNSKLITILIKVNTLAYIKAHTISNSKSVLHSPIT